METDRLLAWLRETLDAAEAAAEAATATTGGPHWHGSDSGLYSNDVANHPGPFLADAYGYTDPRLVAHIVRHDPEAVLRRIDRDRQLLDEHADDGYGECKTCSIPDGTVEVNGIEYEMLAHAPAPCGTIRNLAEGWGWTEETSSE